MFNDALLGREVWSKNAKNGTQTALQSAFFKSSLSIITDLKQSILKP